MLEDITVVQEEKMRREPCRGNSQRDDIMTAVLRYLSASPAPGSVPPQDLGSSCCLCLKCLAPNLHVMGFHLGFHQCFPGHL